MPVLSLPDDFITRATRVLLPRLATPDEREAWLAQAFFLNDPRLYHDLRQVAGAPIVYVTRCITALLTAKCIPGRDVHSLALLLNAVRIGSGPAEQREIDTLVEMLDPICGPDARPVPEPIAPIPITDTGTVPAVKPSNPLQSVDTPEAERTPTVFISYSHRDDDFAARLIADLQNAGHAIWIDTVSIKGGDAWVRSIADGIRNSYAFVTVISPDANASRWVLREYLLAENLRKPIYPVMARQADIPLQMIDRQAVMMHVDYADGLRELLEALPAPSIPLPPADAVIEAPRPAPAAPPSEPMPPQAPSIPVLPPASRSTGAPARPDLGGLFGTLKDAVLGRGRDREEPRQTPAADAKKSTSSPGQADKPAPFPEAPVPVESSEIVYPAADLDEAEQAAPPLNRRAVELTYVQRQWAEAFSAQQDSPQTDDDMILRWMPLPADADLEADTTAAATVHVDSVGAALMAARRAMVVADSPRESAEAVWSALDALMKEALNDPSGPLPVIVDLAKWTDDALPLGAFVRDQLGELGEYWQGLLDQQRAALLFTGLADDAAPRHDARKAAVRAFLQAHPELPALVAMSG